MLQYLRWLWSIYQLGDYIVDHRDSIERVAPQGALLMTWVFSMWAWFSEQPPVVITTIAYAVLAATFSLMNNVPRWLERYRPRPFAIDANSMFTTTREMQVIVSILNRSKHDRVALEFSICLKADGKPETWFTDIDTRRIEKNLDPQKTTAGSLSIDFIGTGYSQDIDFQAWLRVTDRVSRRSAKFRIPGHFPPDFFRLS